MIASVRQIEEFLNKVDKLFPVPLSQKQNLNEYAKKLYEKGTLCAKTENGRILAMVAGYTDNVTDNRGYIAVVATLPEAQGKGFAKKLVLEFLSISKAKALDAVHVYAVPTNTVAVNMYRGIGFTEWKLPDETRPADLHLIYNMKG